MQYEDQLEKLNKQIRNMIETYHQDDCPSTSKREFNSILDDEICSTLNDGDLNNLNRRVDCRGYFSFFEQMYINTQREASIMKAWSLSARKNDNTVKYRSHGVDNNGFPVLTSTNDIKKSDYKLWFNDEYMLVDVKSSPVIKCFTFKLSTLRRYIKEDINILLVLNDSKVPKHWSILNKDFMQNMVNQVYGEHGSHFARGKPTTRIWRDNTKNSIGYLELVRHGLLDLKDF